MSNFFADTFTDTDGTLIENHTTNSGATWLPKLVPAGNGIIAGGLARINTANYTFYLASVTSPSADYVVTTAVKCVTNEGYAQTWGRASYGTTATGYQLTFDSAGSGGSGLSMYKTIAGVDTLLGEEVFTPAAGTTYTIQLSMIGTAIKGLRDGVQKFSVTDSDVAGPGTTGISGSRYSASGSTVGFQWDSISAGDPATLQLEGYRFRNDNGGEGDPASGGATYLAAQDTAIIQALSTNTRLRVILNATSDTVAGQYQLEYKKSSDSIWLQAFPQVNTATLTFGAAGTAVYSASGGTSVAPTYPGGITTRSALVLLVGQKPSTANSGSVTTPTGWTLQTSLIGAGGYATTLGADTGNTNIYVYTKDSVSGSETGALNVTVGTNNVCWGVILRVEADVPVTWSYGATTGSQTVGGNVSVTFSADPGVAGGDYAIVGMCIPTDVSTPAQFSAEALSQTGITYGTVSEVIELDSTTGNDIGGFIVQAPVSSGTSSAAPSLTATAGGTNTNVRGPLAFLRLRATPTNPAIVLATSTNIGSGGTTTTSALLTAPSGKSTVTDFQAGYISDDTNPLPSLDLASDKYTELEWCLKAVSGVAVNGDVYQFRVTVSGTALDTYSVTPSWTIGTASVTDVVSSSFFFIPY
jgi:hypothetical protein